MIYRYSSLSIGRSKHTQQISVSRGNILIFKFYCSEAPLELNRAYTCKSIKSNTFIGSLKREKNTKENYMKCYDIKHTSKIS